jgi:transcriptional regulator with XRE-family HTH domain
MFHLPQNALCDTANMDYTYPSLLERGLRTPSLSVVIEIGRALGIEPAQLVIETLARLRGGEQ